MEAENNNQNENLVTQLYHNHGILESGLSIKRDGKGDYYVSTSLYNKNKAAYDNYKCLLIEDNGITYGELMDLIPEDRDFICIDDEYNNMRILKNVYKKNKSKYDLLGVKILIEIERNYIHVPYLRNGNRQRQMAKALHIMNRPH